MTRWRCTLSSLFYTHIKNQVQWLHCLRGWSMNPLCKQPFLVNYIFFAVHDFMQNIQVIKQLIQNPTEKKTIFIYSKAHNILWPLSNSANFSAEQKLTWCCCFSFLILKLWQFCCAPRVLYSIPHDIWTTKNTCNRLSTHKTRSCGPRTKFYYYLFIIIWRSHFQLWLC